jgi:outer membrane protein assembly factor BamB
MNKNKNKTAIAIALVLILTAAWLMTSIVTVSAEKRSVVGYVSVSPNIAGLSQSLTVVAYIFPTPLAIGSYYPVYENMYVVFTKPDGTTDTKGPFTSYQEGSIFFNYVPDKLGDWSAKLTWAGDEVNEGTESQPYKFTVQQEPVPTTPEVPLPTGPWTRPINSENREWAQIAGQWLMSEYYTGGYNASCNFYNPYSKAPETPHILWKHQYEMGGIIGGAWGDAHYASTYFPSIYPMIMDGRIYYMWDDQIYCLDEQTGDTLWVMPGPVGSRTVQLYCVPGRVLYADRIIERPQSQWMPYLWAYNATHLMKYDGLTGKVMWILTPPQGATFSGWMRFDPVEGYGYTTLGGSMANTLVKWDLWEGGRDPRNTTNSGQNFTKKIVWAKPINKAYILPILTELSGDVIFLATGNDNRTMALDIDTGELLWNITRDYELAITGTSGYGKSYWFSSQDMRCHAFDLRTGTEAWKSEPAEYPWGSFWAYDAANAYGLVYGLCYDGHIYAYNAETGKTVWKFYSGNTTETPYNTWPFWGQPAIADGKIYVGNGEHTPSDPMMRGCRLFSLNATTGEELWNIAFGGGGSKAIADGKLIACNEYDLNIYCFDKGQTATTVEAPLTAIMRGDTVVLRGTVTDQSPAQPGTPAIAEASMREWMEYLNMQKPMPKNATGVDVKLETLDPNGNFYEIGTTTTDMSGMYNLMWEPPVPGKYTIIATFPGSDSYYSSSAETAIGVLEAPAATAPPTAPPASMADIYILPATIGIIVAIAVVGAVLVLMLRKR